MADGISFKFDKTAFDRQVARLIAGSAAARDRAVMAAALAAQKAGRAAVPVLTGRLRDSITARQDRDGTVKVGPRGDPAFLYAGKEEQRKPYMEAARKAAEAALAPALEREIGRLD